MNIQNVFWKIAMVVCWFLTPLAISSQPHHLVLKHGIYVRRDFACQEPPLAAVMSWDGVGFSGPHSSECMSRILNRHGSLFAVRNACAALGDGTPTPSSHFEEFSLTKLSAFSFKLSKGNSPPSAYRWCSAK